MGGMHGFGPVVCDRDEPVFHAEWERRTFALVIAMIGSRAFNLDEFRRTIEQMPPLQYLGATYYERWLHACETLLIEKGVVQRLEIDVMMAALRAIPPTPKAPVLTPGEMARESSRDEDSVPFSMSRDGGTRSLRLDQGFHARFKAGDRVIARTLNPASHTRIPRYVRGHRGIVHRDWGVFVFPDTHAHGLGANPQHCYSVQFDACELWGSDRPAGDRAYIDLWEAYLDVDIKAAVLDAKPRTNGSCKAVAEVDANAHAAKPPRKSAAKKSRSRKTPKPHANDQGIRHE
jgi:nitrile hydratase subunit beta